jgi:hypothetical protein
MQPIKNFFVSILIVFLFYKIGSIGDTTFQAFIMITLLLLLCDELNSYDEEDEV